MPRNMSFKLTQQQIRERAKFVTRRNGWENVKVGEVLNAIVQGQGLKKGARVEKICQIRVTEAWRERLDTMLKPSQALEPPLEGFPLWTQADFVQFYCEANKCKPDKVITRIRFEYL